MVAHRQLGAEAAVLGEVDDDRGTIAAELHRTHTTVREVVELLRARLRAQGHDKLAARGEGFGAARRFTPAELREHLAQTCWRESRAAAPRVRPGRLVHSGGHGGSYGLLHAGPRQQRELDDRDDRDDRDADARERGEPPVRAPRPAVQRESFCRHPPMMRRARSSPPLG